MKHIKKYKIFESQSYQKINDIHETLKDICLELSDRDIKYVISPSDDINRKVLGLQLFTYILDESRFKVPFFIMINSRPIKDDIKWFIDFMHQIESYMNSVGFNISISVRDIKSIADMSGFVSKSISYFEERDSLDIRDIKIEFTKK